MEIYLEDYKEEVNIGSKIPPEAIKTEDAITENEE